MSKRDITAVYIRGCAFKAMSGGRRHMILNNLKRLDESAKPNVYVIVAIGVVIGYLAGYFSAGYMP